MFNNDEFIYWYWIYSGIRYILPTIGVYILVLDIFCQQFGDICQLEDVCAPFVRNVYIFIKAYSATRFTDILQLTYMSSNCWQKISNTNIYSPTYIFILNIYCQQLYKRCNCVVVYNCITVFVHQPFGNIIIGPR